MGGAIILCAQCVLGRWRHMVALSELLVIISIAFGFLLKHNSEYTTQKIKYWYVYLIWYDMIPHCVAFVCNFQSKGKKGSNVRLS